MLKTKFGVWDGVVCAGVAAAAGLLLFAWSSLAGGSAATVLVSQAGTVLYETPLAGAARTYAVGGDYPLTVRVEDGRVWVEDATCPGHDCEKQGTIDAPGETIACLPDRVTVTITGQSETDVIIG